MVLLVDGLWPDSQLEGIYGDSSYQVWTPSTYEDLVGAFTKSWQTQSVEEYQTTFKVLSNKIIEVSEEFHISIFLSG